MRRKGSGQLSIQLLSCRTGYRGPIRGRYSVMWCIVTSNTHLMTKYKIGYDVDCHGEYISGELFTRQRKRRSSFLRLREERTSPLYCQRVDYGKKLLLCMFCSGIFQKFKGLRTIKTASSWLCQYLLLSWRTIWRANDWHFAVCKAWQQVTTPFLLSVEVGWLTI